MGFHKITHCALTGAKTCAGNFNEIARCDRHLLVKFAVSEQVDLQKFLNTTVYNLKTAR